jgi:hypothetical protein
MIWVAGVLLLSGYHLAGWQFARRFVKLGAFPAPPEWQERFDELQEEFNLRRSATLLLSKLVKVPCVVGWIKPVILLPVSLLTSLSPSEMEMILVHEIAHVQRYDVLVNMMQSAMETLFFFNPAIWWISRQIRIEREDCCDDPAILKAGSRIRYARALTNLEELRMCKANVGTAINEVPFRSRIQRIVGNPRPPYYSAMLSLSGMLPLAFLIIVILGPIGLPDQSALHASENVLSAQPYDPEPGDLQGEWEVESNGDELKILVYGKGSSGMNFTIDRDEVADLIDQGRVSFKIARDAGTTFFEGTLKKRGRTVGGRGEWYFHPDSAYVHFMSSQHGFPVDDTHKVFSFAIFDISRDYVEELSDAGYPTVPYDRLLSMLIQGITAKDAREFERLGCGHLTPDELISARNQDITPEYVESFRKAGFDDLTFKNFSTLHAFKLDADDFEDCYRHRFMDLSQENMVWVCGFGITQKDIERIKDRGYTDIDSIIEALAEEYGQ